MKIVFASMLALLAGFGVVLGAAAQGTGSSELSRSDARFLQRAAADGLAEVQLGQLAQQKGLREEVKQFGKLMVVDHTKANQQAQAIAQAHNVQLPTTLDKKHERELKKLSGDKLVGPDFDREYMAKMVSDHRKDVSQFRKRANAKTQTDVTRFAAATLPTLVSHLESARATNDLAQAGKRTGERATGSTKP
jgi:putative membrane protein